MTDITRRKFLQGVGVVAAGLLLGNFSILFPDEQVLGGLEYFGNFRVMCLYNAATDTEIVKYDILTANEWLYTYSIVANVKDQSHYVRRCHNVMVAAMQNELQRKQIHSKDLITMEYPPGYKHPEWFQKLLKEKE